MQPVPQGRAARPVDGVLSRARIAADTAAPCVLATERPSHPCDERHYARPSLAVPELIDPVLVQPEEVTDLVQDGDPDLAP